MRLSRPRGLHTSSRESTEKLAGSLALLRDTNENGAMFHAATDEWYRSELREGLEDSAIRVGCCRSTRAIDPLEYLKPVKRRPSKVTRPAHGSVTKGSLLLAGRENMQSWHMPLTLLMRRWQSPKGRMHILLASTVRPGKPWRPRIRGRDCREVGYKRTFLPPTYYSPSARSLPCCFESDHCDKRPGWRLEISMSLRLSPSLAVVFSVTQQESHHQN